MNNGLGCYLDKCYCASPNCKNECGRKMSPEIKEAIQKIPNAHYSMAYFCGEEIEEDLIK